MDVRIRVMTPEQLPLICHHKSLLKSLDIHIGCLVEWVSELD